MLQRSCLLAGASNLLTLHTMRRIAHSMPPSRAGMLAIAAYTSAGLDRHFRDVRAGSMCNAILIDDMSALETLIGETIRCCHVDLSKRAPEGKHIDRPACSYAFAIDLLCRRWTVRQAPWNLNKQCGRYQKRIPLEEALRISLFHCRHTSRKRFSTSELLGSTLELPPIRLLRGCTV